MPRLFGVLCRGRVICSLLVFWIPYWNAMLSMLSLRPRIWKLLKKTENLWSGFFLGIADWGLRHCSEWPSGLNVSITEGSHSLHCHWSWGLAARASACWHYYSRISLGCEKIGQGLAWIPHLNAVFLLSPPHYSVTSSTTHQQEVSGFLPKSKSLCP